MSIDLTRRVALKKMAIASGMLLTSRVFSQTTHHHAHDHHEMPTVPEKAKKLLASDQLPQHQALPQLMPLKNFSKTAQHFQSKLHASPVSVAFSPNHKTICWAYNNQVPAPLIEVFEGDTVEIELVNQLPQATTLHWHGLPVPPDQDGNPQDLVLPGQSRVYQFTLPEGCAGTYWYHPHAHGTVAEQVFRGLAGAFIVHPKQDRLAHIPSQYWFISDLRLDDQGNIPENTSLDWMNGREGQFVLINGAYQPDITLSSATRVRVWNATNGRYLKLALADAQLLLLGSDGGLLEKPQPLSDIFLSPGERVEVLIIPMLTKRVALETLAYERGKMGNVAPEQTVTIAQVNLTRSVMPELPLILKKFPLWAEATTKKTLEYTEVMQEEKMQFFINGQSHDPERIDLVSQVNTIEEWTIFNNTHMDHNFHLHGTQFVVIAHQWQDQNIVPTYQAFKDTINLRPYETIRIKTQQAWKGLRLYHCHILEHEALGMMGQLQVV